MSHTPKATVQEAVNEFRRKANGQVVLVLQGGGALGAYQVGVYQALHEAGVEPDWIVGTSIGATADVLAVLGATSASAAVRSLIVGCR